LFNVINIAFALPSYERSTVANCIKKSLSSGFGTPADVIGKQCDSSVKQLMGGLYFVVILALVVELYLVFVIWSYYRELYKERQEKEKAENDKMDLPNDDWREFYALAKDCCCCFSLGTGTALVFIIYIAGSIYSFATYESRSHLGSVAKYDLSISVFNFALAVYGSNAWAKESAKSLQNAAIFKFTSNVLFYPTF
jgi:hypothetical protein